MVVNHIEKQQQQQPVSLERLVSVEKMMQDEGNMQGDSLKATKNTKLCFHFFYFLWAFIVVKLQTREHV